MADLRGARRSADGRVCAGHDLLFAGGGCGDPAGSDGVDGDALGRHFESECAHHAGHGGLAGPISRTAGIAHERTGDGGDMDDAPIAPAQHLRQGCARHPECDVEIDLNGARPFGIVDAM